MIAMLTRDRTFVYHNDSRYNTAKWLSEVCYDMAIEPSLQPLTAEIIVGKDY